MTAPMLPVRNPRTGEWDHEIPITSPEDIASITTALRAEQAQWVAMGASGRAACLNRFADAVMAEVGPLGQALSIRPDILSPQAMVQLQQLCDKVPPFDSAIAMQCIRDELGVKVNRPRTRPNPSPAP